MFWVNHHVPSHYFSDRCSILFDLTTTKPLLSRKKISFRVTKDIDMPALMNDISTSRLCLDPPNDIDGLVGCYNTPLSSLLNRYAPIKTRFVTIIETVPWYTEEVRAMKRERRRAERKWKTSRSDADFNRFRGFAKRI